VQYDFRSHTLSPGLRAPARRRHPKIELFLSVKLSVVLANFLRCGVIALLTAMPLAARAGGGLLGLDHTVTYDDSGIWNRTYQNWLIYSMVGGEIGVGLWEGGETRFGHTIWQSIDSSAISAVAADILKISFSRERPDQTNNPDEWFKGHGYQSFPSGEVTTISSIVTPLVLEYGSDKPAVYALEVLPIYDAIARVKVRGHWPSDVIAGYALGSGIGYLMHARQNTPLVLSIMPHSIYVGLKQSF
jgi:membrane-associated phospholipid phosphatase